jgi:hypothetical protein
MTQANTSNLSDEQIASGLGLKSDEPAGILAIGSGEVAPRERVNLFATRTKEYEAKQARELEDRAFKRASDEIDNQYKKALTAKTYKEARPGGYEDIKRQLELKKIQDEEKEKNLALEVPGYGLARTKEEAKDIRSAMSDANEAKQIIGQIKNLGTDVAWWDRDKVGKINQLKQVLAGKLRLPLTGPGAMTEDEFQRLISNMGDPSSIFGSEENEIGKLGQLEDILDKAVQSKFAAASRDPYAPKAGWSGDPEKVALRPMDFRGQNPAIPYAPTNVPNVSPIQNAVAGELKQVDDKSLLSRREELLRKRGGR